MKKKAEKQAKLEEQKKQQQATAKLAELDLSSIEEDKSLPSAQKLKSDN